MIVHFEIPADDVARARSFYNDLFGWEFSEAPGFPGYWSFSTGEEDSMTGGAVMKRQHGEHLITNYIGVASVDESIAKIEALGGTIVVPKSPVQGMGWMAWFRDPEGNVMALWQPDETAQ
jgi:predicted enzyme related to lactoylglutathione lyase